MKIQIHKNRLKKYFDMNWDDVPEFVILETEPTNFVAVKFTDSKDLLEQINKFIKENSN